MANMGMEGPAKATAGSIMWRIVERKEDTVRKRVVKNKVALERKAMEAVILIKWARIGKVARKVRAKANGRARTKERKEKERRRVRTTERALDRYAIGAGGLDTRLQTVGTYSR